MDTMHEALESAHSSGGRVAQCMLSPLWLALMIASRRRVSLQAVVAGLMS